MKFRKKIIKIYKMFLEKKIIFINSIPKSGTHYLQNIFDRLNLIRTGKTINAHSGEFWMLDYQEFIQSNGELINKNGVVFADTTGGSWSSLKFAKEFIDDIFFIKKTRKMKYHFMIGHALYSNVLQEFFKTHNTKQIVLLRNPIEIAKALTYANHDIFANLRPINKKCRTFILGGAPYSFDKLSIGIVPMLYIFKNMAKWLKNDDVYPFFFEDIIGNTGGGSTKLATYVINDFFKKLGIRRTNEEISNAINHSFGNSPTFRKGLISSNNMDFEKYLNVDAKKTLIECHEIYNRIRSEYGPKITNKLN